MKNADMPAISPGAQAVSAGGGKGQPELTLNLKAVMESASRVRWAAAHSSELVRAAEEFDAAREVVAALVEALKEASESLGHMGAEHLKSRVDAALRAAGVATEGGLEE